MYILLIFEATPPATQSTTKIKWRQQQQCFRLSASRVLCSAHTPRPPPHTHAAMHGVHVRVSMCLAFRAARIASVSLINKQHKHKNPSVQVVCVLVIGGLQIESLPLFLIATTISTLLLLAAGVQSFLKGRCLPSNFWI